MKRLSAAIAATVLLGAGIAYGQEAPGAGRYEISAMPAGGMFFTSADEKQPEFGNYVMGGMFAYNFNRWVGMEGEGGGLIGVRQHFTFDGTTFGNQHTPYMLGYTGNLVLHPWGNRRAFAPFVIGGVGGLTLLNTDQVTNLGITSRSTFLTGNVGGGLKWFSAQGWGVRTEYRFMTVDGKQNAPAFFGRDTDRYGHRFSAGLLYTY